MQGKLDEAEDVSESDKAIAIKAMLQEDVIGRLTGNPVLDNPECPADMWNALRAAYPSNPAALVLALRGLKQSSNETNVKYLQRCKALHVQHQCDLPQTWDAEGKRRKKRFLKNFGAWVLTLTNLIVRPHYP